MEHIATIKRKSIDKDIDYTNCCFFCQNHAPANDLRAASIDGKHRTTVVADQRRKLGDTANVDVLARLEMLSAPEFEELEVKWHKSCYSNFTSEFKLCRLRKQRSAHVHIDTCTGDSEHDSPSLSGQQRPTRRSCQSPMDWKLCMFCQRTSDKKKLHSVTTFAKSATVLDYAQADPVMSRRLAGVSDLIAAEACYHLSCWVTFERQCKPNTSTAESDGDTRDVCFDNLCVDIKAGLSCGHVYEMTEVWNRYEDICRDMGKQLPQKYLSRRSTFYERVQHLIGPKANYVRSLSRSSLLMYPGDQSEFIIAKSLSKYSQQETFSSDPESSDTDDASGTITQGIHTSIFMEMVHVALCIKHELSNTPGHDGAWRGIDQEHIDHVIPESLYMFLRLLFGGIDVVNDGINDDEQVKQKVCSISQDIVYAVSNGRKLTPKHIGLGLALHQATRSEAMVELFHAANHTIGIDTVRRFDSAIAQNIIDKFMRNGYVYIPDNIVSDRMIHCSCDNIDVLEATLDGKNTFHCTQMMVWQRGPAPKHNDLPVNKVSMRDRTIKADALQAFQKLDQARLPHGQRSSPSIHAENEIDVDDWFRNEERKSARAKDMAWVVSRICDSDDDGGHMAVPAWGAFNEAISVVDPEVTTAGMLPILQAPADDYNTLTTVINRFVSISNAIGQKHTIITADQPLYSRGKELVWANPEFENVIFLMGGLHICFNFLKAIGQHMENAGLDDLWAESGVYATNSVEAMMHGKAYYRAVRAHKLTYEALWHIKWDLFEAWLSANNRSHASNVRRLAENVAQVFHQRNETCREDLSTSVDELSLALSGHTVQCLLDEFSAHHNGNPNFTLWTTYMTMVETLLAFIRAERDGNWLLHLESFAVILPWLTIYDHTNYARWGPVYLAEMKALQSTAPEIYAEFTAGNFVVKRSRRRFNQISADHATEWINRMCKLQNGIIGITRNDQARDKFCVTWSERSRISEDTRRLFDLEDGEEEAIFTRSDSLPSRMGRDTDDVKRLSAQLRRFDVFRVSTTITCLEDGDGDADASLETISMPLVSLATKDTATHDITTDLESAEERGKQNLVANVQQRLIEGTVKFHDTMKRHNSKTFAHLYKAHVSSTTKVQKTIKADRKLLQRLLNVVNAGRVINMLDILKHELSPVPLSLAKAGGDMNATPKAELLNILSANVDSPSTVPDTDQKTCVFIDGHALVQVIGKPPGCQTFGQYAEVFNKAVMKHFGQYTSRVDVVFDQYIGAGSIKAATRSKRMGKTRPIRKLIDGPDVPLPTHWSQFIALDQNKADLANFLSEELMKRGIGLDQRHELVTGGGFTDPTCAKSTRRDNINLAGNHEEADTRLILHACEAVTNGYERVLVMCRDTDVMLLLIHFLSSKPVETWMISGTAMKRKCYPVHIIARTLAEPVKDNLLSFHALTGCDTTSSFSGHGKKSCWKIFEKHPQLVNGIGRDGDPADTERFICSLYGVPEAETINHARLHLFSKANKGLEKLPPTQDAMTLHLSRANYQAKIWLQADQEIINVTTPADTSGWKMEMDALAVVWETLPPVPDACLELVTCGCKSKCSTARCTCFRNNFKCTPACACDAINCSNPV